MNIFHAMGNVICKKCGGQHPVWECQATAAKVAAFKAASAVAPDVPRANTGSASPAHRGESDAEPHEAPKGAPAKATKSSGGSSAVERQPSKLGVAGSTPARRSKKGRGRKLSVSTPAATGIEPRDSAPGVRPIRPKSTAPGKDRVTSRVGKSAALEASAPAASPKADAVSSEPEQSGGIRSGRGLREPSQQAGTQAPPVDTDSLDLSHSDPEVKHGKGAGRSSSVILVEAEAAAAHLAPAKRGRGRPAQIADMKAYKREKAREYRARLKAEGQAK